MMDRSQTLVLSPDVDPAGIAPGTAGGTARPEPTPSEAFVAIGQVANPTFSKDGRRVFHLSGSSNPQLAVLDLDSGEISALTAHDDKVWLARRAPTDDRIVYAVDRGGDERHQLYLLDPATGAARALTAAPEVIHGFGAWSPDGARIAYAANARDPAHTDVHVMDLGTGVARRVLDGDGLRSVGAFSPDGRRLIVTDERGSSDMTLRILDLGDGSSRELPRPGKTRYQGARFVAEGAGLMLLTDHGREVMGLAAIDLASGDLRWIHAPEFDLDGYALSPDATRVAVVENVEGYARLAVMAADGSGRVEIAGHPPGQVADPAWSPDGTRLVFTLSGPTAPASVWLWTAEDGRLVRLTEPELGGLAADSFVPYRTIGFPTFDGRTIPGFLLVPRGSPPTAGWPAVVWVHGGPEAQARANFRPDMQLLADRGYAVLMPNVRGSTGYGRTYAGLDDVERRMDSVRDLAHAHAWLAAQPGVDRSRIGIMGQSYGGFMVLSAITTFPRLWKAAVDYYGVANFITLLETTGPWRRRHRAAEYGDPERDAALLRRISPMSDIGRAGCPLLVLHGDRDPRVPIGESEQVVAALRRLALPVEYRTFPYQGHGFTRAEDRRTVYAAVADFFGRWL